MNNNDINYIKHFLSALKIGDYSISDVKTQSLNCSHK